MAVPEPKHDFKNSGSGLFLFVKQRSDECCFIIIIHF